MKQQSLLSPLFSPSENPKGVLCDRCLKNNCGCHEDFMKQTTHKGINFKDEIKKDYGSVRYDPPTNTINQMDYAKDMDDINFEDFSENGYDVSRQSKTFSEFIFSTNPATNKYLYDASFSEKLFSATTPYGGYGSAAKQAAALKSAMAAQVKKVTENPIYAAAVMKAVDTAYNNLSPAAKAQVIKQSVPATKPATTYLTQQEAPEYSDPYGGYGSAAAQETAERNLLTLMKQKYPEQFTGLADEIYMKITEPARAQTPIIGQGQVNAAREALGLSPINVVVTTTGGKGSEPYTNLRGDSFESLFPKQTSQLIKIGQDLTWMGSKLTEVDSRENSDKNAIYEDLRKYRKDFLEPKLVDYDKKFVDLGKSVSDASGGTLILGMPSNYLIIAALAVGVLALVMGVRK